jgi:hypothetical protein
MESEAVLSCFRPFTKVQGELLPEALAALGTLYHIRNIKYELTFSLPRKRVRLSGGQRSRLVNDITQICVPEEG